MWKKIFKGVGIAATAVGLDKLYNKIVGENTSEKKTNDEQYENLHNTIITNIRETVNNNHNQVLSMGYIFAAIILIIFCIILFIVLAKYYQKKMQKKYNQRYERRLAANNANQDVRVEL